MDINEYHSFRHLQQGEMEGRDYVIRCLSRDMEFAVIAPHGGEIEPGTTEVAEAIAGDRFSFYTLVGIKTRGNKRLHIVSEHFDEHKACSITKASKTGVAIQVVAVMKTRYLLEVWLWVIGKR